MPSRRSATPPACIGRDVACAEPRPLPRAGLYRPDQPAPGVEPADRPQALVVFYRALVQSGDLAPIDALLRALEAEGLAAVGLYVTSLKDAEAAAADPETIAGRAAPGGGPQRDRASRPVDRRPAGRTPTRPCCR